jgi:hypothetical protein
MLHLVNPDLYIKVAQIEIAERHAAARRAELILQFKPSLTTSLVRRFRSIVRLRRARNADGVTAIDSVIDCVCCTNAVM